MKCIECGYEASDKTQFEQTPSGPRCTNRERCEQAALVWQLLKTE